MHAVDILVEEKQWTDALPALEDCALAALGAAAAANEVQGTVSVLFADDGRMKALNSQYRGRDKPTNVLSFPTGDMPSPLADVVLGDLVLGFETVAREAAAADLSLKNHLSHLLVHGYLHLLGYDHETEDEAVEMEALEVAILKTLDIANPYADDVEDCEVGS